MRGWGAGRAGRVRAGSCPGAPGARGRGRPRGAGRRVGCGGGERGRGLLPANTRGAVAAVGEMEPGREGEALWDRKQGPCCWLVPVLLACCVRGHLRGDQVVSASIFPVFRKSGQKP